MNEYEHCYEDRMDEDPVLGEPRQRRRKFVRAGRAFLKMQRPHFDADALIYKAARCGIHAIRKTATGRRGKACYSKRRVEEG